MLDMTREALSKASEVAQATIADFETGRRQPYPRTLAAIRAALEAAGIEFIEENGGGPGVRLRQPSTSHVADPQHPEMRSVGPEDETRGGPEAPERPDVQTDN